MKKIILTLSGVLFVIVTGCSLLICMMNGIPNLDQPAAAFYLAKAILLSFSLPLVTLGLFVHCLQLLFCLPTAFFGKHVGIRGIHILTCSDIHVNSATALPIHIDGESGGIREDLTVSIEKSSLKIILPVV